VGGKANGMRLQETCCGHRAAVTGHTALKGPSLSPFFFDLRHVLICITPNACQAGDCLCFVLGVSYKRPVTTQPITKFDCPQCGTPYKIVRVESDTIGSDRKITCISCGAPLNGREGRLILKYFRTDRPRAQPGERHASL